MGKWGALLLVLASSLASAKERTVEISFVDWSSFHGDGLRIHVLERDVALERCHGHAGGSLKVARRRAHLADATAHALASAGAAVLDHPPDVVGRTGIPDEVSTRPAVTEAVRTRSLTVWSTDRGKQPAPLHTLRDALSTAIGETEQAPATEVVVPGSDSGQWPPG